MKHITEEATMAHAHTCLTCSVVIETGDFDCEFDRDHDDQNCNDCAARAAGVDWAERERDALTEEGPELLARLRQPWYAIDNDALPLVADDVDDEERARLARIVNAAAAARWEDMLSEANEVACDEEEEA